MAKIDETKERISYLKNFLTMILGALIITIGGVANLFLTEKLGVIFGLGIISIGILVYAALRLIAQIEKHLKDLGEL
jgi:hypothetical protein